MRHKRLNQHQVLSIVGRQGHFHLNPLAYSSQGTRKTLKAMCGAGTLRREIIAPDHWRYTRAPKEKKPCSSEP